jgi:predicted transcriptional regulator
MMRSERWTGDPDTSKRRIRGQPYILPSGHISGSVYLKWRCTAHQWFATTVRSVIEKLRKRGAVKQRCSRKNRHQITMMAILYVCTNDARMLERLLNCKAKGFTRVFWHYLHHVDDKKLRFLYDQAVNAALWFELRGNPRVQSTKKTILPEYRRFGIRSYDSRRERREAVQSLSDPWIVQNAHFTKGMSFLAI